MEKGDERLPAGGEIPFNRSVFDHETGGKQPRQQINQISAYIDASNVYGSDEERASALRASHTHLSKRLIRSKVGAVFLSCLLRLQHQFATDTKHYLRTSIK